jgi:hypothetical protein
MISLKAFHGCIMFVSWINIAGRLFVTPPTSDFECYTQPVFKQAVGNGKHTNYTEGDPLTLVPFSDPNYGRVPWAYKEQQWAAMMLLAPYFGAFVVGVIFTAVAVNRSKGKHVDVANAPLNNENANANENGDNQV